MLTKISMKKFKEAIAISKVAQQFLHKEAKHTPDERSIVKLLYRCGLAHSSINEITEAVSAFQAAYDTPVGRVDASVKRKLNETKKMLAKQKAKEQSRMRRAFESTVGMESPETVKDSGVESTVASENATTTATATTTVDSSAIEVTARMEDDR
jgi:hypothetical protein